MKKITRRTILRASGLAAASLALSGCAPTGSACVGNGFSDWLQQTLGKSGSAASSESTEAAAPDAGAASEAPAESADSSLPAYNADPLTGEPRRSNGRMVGVMVNNISNTQRQNARPQRGLGSADLLIESKVEGGITRFLLLFRGSRSRSEVVATFLAVLELCKARVLHLAGSETDCIVRQKRDDVPENLTF